jgi:hypothetical protein
MTHGHARDQRPPENADGPRSPRELRARGSQVFALLLVALTIVVLLALTVAEGLTAGALLPGPVARTAQGKPTLLTPSPGLSSGGPLPWTGGTVTTASGVVVNTSSRGLSVAPAFHSYYQRHGGATQLGAPITPPFSSAAGLTQFFPATALVFVAPASSPRHVAAPADPRWGEVLANGIHDPQSGTVELPLLHSLLTVGSLAPIADSPFTYADLRAATDPTQRVVEPAGASSGDGVFVPEAPAGKQFAGHWVPSALWHYINQPQSAPEGWRIDVGQPLTEALPFTRTAGHGTIHHAFLQVFWQTALVVDQDTRDASGTPLIERVRLGQDYLATLDYPTAITPAGTSQWVTTATDVTATPGGPGVAQVGAQWPLTLSGSAQWVAGRLWYAITWRAGNQTAMEQAAMRGWILAATLTDSAPPPGYVGRGIASLAALSPTLATSVQALHGAAGVPSMMSRATNITAWTTSAPTS